MRLTKTGKIRKPDRLKLYKQALEDYQKGIAGGRTEHFTGILQHGLCYYFEDTTKKLFPLGTAPDFYGPQDSLPELFEEATRLGINHKAHWYEQGLLLPRIEILEKTIKKMEGTNG